MKTRPTIFWALLPLVFVLLSVALWSCNVSDDDDDDGGDNDATPSPNTHTKAMEALAVGDRVYRYRGGLWSEVEGVPSAAMPFQAVDYISGDEGWVAGTGYIYHVTGETWTLDSPLIQNNVPFHRVRVGADGRVWALANRFEESGGHIMIRGLDGVWADTDLDEQFPAETGAQAIDIQMLADGTVLVLLRVGQSNYLRRFAADGTYVDEPVYQFDPVNWLTLRSMGLDQAGAILIGGRFNNGINKLGNVWRFADGALTATDPPSPTCLLQDVTRLALADSVVFMLGLCDRSTMYRLDGAAWTEVALPGEKGAEWRVNDMAFINAVTGWAVGYSDKLDAALLLLRDTDGWILVPAPEDPSGVHLYGVDVWPSSLSGDDDIADDDTTDDDVDDDTTDDDVVDDDAVDDDATDDDTV